MLYKTNLKTIEEIKNSFIGKSEWDVKYFLKDNSVYADNVEFAKFVITEVNPLCLRFFSKNIKNNYQVVELAVKKRGIALEFASKELMANKSLALLYMTHDTKESYSILPTKLKMDREVVENFLKISKAQIELIPSVFFEIHKDITEKLLIENGRNLNKFSNKIKNDLEFVLTAVTSDGSSFEFSSKEMRANRLVVETACKTHPRALYFASKKLKNDRDLIRMVLQKDGTCLKFLDIKHTDDEELALIAVKNSGKVLFYMSSRLKANKEIAQLALENNIKAWTHIDHKIMMDKDILTSLFKRSIPDFSFNLNAIKFEPDIKKHTNAVKENLKTKPQEFFIETYNNIDESITQEIYSNSKMAFDIYFEFTNKETLQHIKTINKFSFMNKILDQEILRKDLNILNIPNQEKKKDRKIGFGI